MDRHNLPHHLAIIMDGNGRWAISRRHNRFFGHVRGAQVAKETIRYCSSIGIKNLTLFAFSTENWLRPFEEVRFLMRLLKRQLAREQGTLMENNIRFRCIGELDRLPLDVRQSVQETVELTAKNTGMTLIFALSYGGRQEITQAARMIAESVKAGNLQPEQIDEAVFSAQLESSFLPEVDLIIRTSGEQRISNFFLWGAAYAEFYFSEKMWPDFTSHDLEDALADFAERNRRFGRISFNEPLTIVPSAPQ